MDKHQDILDTYTAYLGKIPVRSQLIYILIIGMIIAGIASLPFLYFDISVAATGMVRPAEERTLVRNAAPGKILHIAFRDGQRMNKGDTLMLIDAHALQESIQYIHEQIEEKELYKSDLEKIIQNPGIPIKLKVPALKEQSDLFLAKKAAILLQQNKLQHELQVARKLSTDKVIAPREFENTLYQYNLVEAESKTLSKDQLSLWQAALHQTIREIESLRAERYQKELELNLYVICAPVSGIVESSNEWYTGNQLMGSETICTISPDAMLIGECYLPTREVGFVKAGQPCIYQVDAFNYNRFGVLGGEIQSVAGDFILIDNKPAYRVRSTFSRTAFQLPNGFSGDLKKGMTYRVRFFITRRSAWQLLYDKIDDWINPGIV